MKSALAYPTWDQIDSGCSRIAIALLDYTDVPNLVVGLSRGGLIPAVRISHLMSQPFAAVEYSSNAGNGETASGVANDLEYQVNYLTQKYCDTPMNVVIVDDIVDTGHTMREVLRSFVSFGWNTLSAGLFVRHGSVHQPSVVWQTINEDDSWIIFPWEL
jgi:hypoxanthine phosphoribosyltransferase